MRALPRLSIKPTADEISQYIIELDKYVKEMNLQPRNNTTFTTSNYTVSNSLNAGTATLAQLANYVATLAESLKATGIIK